MHNYVLPSSETHVPLSFAATSNFSSQALCFLGLSSLELAFTLELTFQRQPTRCPQSSLPWHSWSRWCKWPGTYILIHCKNQTARLLTSLARKGENGAKKNYYELSFMGWLWICPCLKIISNSFNQIKWKLSEEFPICKDGHRWQELAHTEQEAKNRKSKQNHIKGSMSKEFLLIDCTGTVKVGFCLGDEGGGLFDFLILFQNA